MMLVPLQKDVSKEIYIFGLYPPHPNYLVDISIIPGMRNEEEGPKPEVRAFCHRNGDFVFEYLFECKKAFRGLFWGVAHTDEQKEAVDEYWKSLTAIVSASSCIGPIDYIECNSIVHEILTKVADGSEEGAVMANSREGIDTVVTVINTLYEKTGWKGPFLIIDETTSEWKKKFKFRVLSLIGCKENREILETNVFPVYDFSCDRVPDAFHYNMVITTRRIVNEDRSFFDSVPWQVVVEWGNEMTNVRGRFVMAKEFFVEEHTPEFHPIMIQELSDSDDVL